MTPPAPPPLPKSRQAAAIPQPLPKALDPLIKAPANIPWKSCHIFFYGTLQDPDLLISLLSLPSPPFLRPASTSGYRVKMWGIYPTLVPFPAHSHGAEEGDGEGEVRGVLWRCDEEEQFDKLAVYETSAYTCIICDAVVHKKGRKKNKNEGDGEGEGEVVKGVRVFVWAGGKNSKELEEGSFDFERWVRYFKGSVVRQRA